MGEPVDARRRRMRGAREVPRPVSEAEGRTRVVALSDTHGAHARCSPLPPGDVLLHAGDFTHIRLPRTDRQLDDFRQWLLAQPFGERLVIMGNHEHLLRSSEGTWRGHATLEVLAQRLAPVRVAGHELVDICHVTVFASSFDFNIGKPAGMQRADVLLTHMPPLGVLDGERAKHSGVSWLYDASKLFPVHVFGHFHRAGAAREREGGTLYINAAHRAYCFVVSEGQATLVGQLAANEPQ
eukprot:m51a1_g8505 hypothetical protein (239) ;mRNA; r:66045-67017